jgi:hypothetical protein
LTTAGTRKVVPVPTAFAQVPIRVVEAAADLCLAALPESLGAALPGEAFGERSHRLVDGRLRYDERARQRVLLEEFEFGRRVDEVLEEQDVEDVERGVGSVNECSFHEAVDASGQGGVASTTSVVRLPNPLLCGRRQCHGGVIAIAEQRPARRGEGVVDLLPGPVACVEEWSWTASTTATHRQMERGAVAGGADDRGRSSRAAR